MTDEPTSTAELPSPPTREDYEAVMRTDGGQLHLLAISRADNNFEQAAEVEAELLRRGITVTFPRQEESAGAAR